MSITFPGWVIIIVVNLSIGRLLEITMLSVVYVWTWLVYFHRKRNKDEQINSQVAEKRREIKTSKEEEQMEQKRREKESSRAYERWLNRKVLYASFKFTISYSCYDLSSQ